MKPLNNELLYYLGFSYCPGIGPMKFQNLKSHLRGVRKAYLASRKELELVLGFKLAEKFIEFRRKFDPKKELEKLSKKGISVLAVDDENYPKSLKNISDPPICLYVKGNLKLDSAESIFITRESSPSRHSGRVPLESEKITSTSSPKICFAIVGTRKPTSYGQQIAYKFARELAEAGFIIVSGMAIGIDTVAHQSTLDAGGKTIAVLGCGVDIIYPAINYQLYKNIIKTGGAVISEFPPNQTVLKGLFISRNRIISGLSRGILIIEGGEYSGTLITAKYAGIQGKDVFAVPSSINSDMSRAPNLLLKQGAKLVTKVEDIMEEFDIKITPRKKEDIRKNLSENEKLIFDILQKNQKTIDDLAIKLGKTVSEILNIISVLEVNGVVEKNQEHKYQIRLII
jgi:DNA processing protein